MAPRKKKKGGLGGLISQKQLPAVLTAIVVIIALALFVGTGQLRGFLKSQANNPVSCVQFGDTYPATPPKNCAVKAFLVEEPNLLAGTNEAGLYTGSSPGFGPDIHRDYVDGVYQASVSCQINCGCEFVAIPPNDLNCSSPDVFDSNTACTSVANNNRSLPSETITVTVNERNDWPPGTPQGIIVGDAILKLKQACGEAIGTTCNNATCDSLAADITSTTTVTCRKCLVTTPTPPPPSNVTIPGEVCYDSWFGIIEVPCPTPTPSIPAPRISASPTPFGF
ncbi:MAG: hypothetical protein HYZ63_03430 [Candidatus Andersenbacteria bacterium]|nr:hypothetical protein [Candidatus Andersenbacteria bacterium]